MDWKIKITSFVLVVLSSFPGCSGAWTTDLDLEATGVNYGLSLDMTLTGNDAETQSYFVDFDDGNLASEEFSSVFVTNYDNPAYYNISVFVGNSIDFSLHFFPEFYVGDKITGYDTSNGSQELTLPVTAGSDFVVGASMLTGSHVVFNVTVLNTQAKKQIIDQFNGTNYLTLEESLFAGVGIYTVQLVAYNPLTDPQVKHIVLAITEEIVVASTEFGGYTSGQPIHLMKGVSFSIITTLTSGHDVTFSYAFKDTGGTIMELVGEHCKGLVRVHTFSYSFRSTLPTGEYTLILEMSNYNSNVTEIHQVFLYYEVNNFEASTTSALQLNMNPVTFDITAQSAGIKMGQGTVTCTATYDDGNSDPLVWDLTGLTLASDDTKTFTHTYVAGLYTCTVICQNGIPLVLPDPTLITHQTFTVDVTVVNTVANIDFTDDSPDRSDHKIDQAVTMTISLSPPSSLPLERLTCVFDFDETNAPLPSDQFATVLGDVTSTSSITTVKSFTEGDRTFNVYVNCSNELTSLRLGPFTYDVKFACWKKSNYFDAGFKDINTPRKTKTNSIFELSADVQFTGICLDDYVIQWTWYLNDVVHLTYTTTSTVFVQPADTMEPNLYKVELKITFQSGAAMADFIYVDFELPAVVCNIVSGGSSKGEGHNQQTALAMTIDASASSDPGQNLPSQAALSRSFIWTCQTGPGLTSDALATFFGTTTMPAGTTDCSSIFGGGTTSEMYTIPANTLAVGSNYLIGLTQIKGNRNCTKHQAISALSEPSLNVSFVELTNCIYPVYKLTFEDLQLNVAVFEKEVDNTTLVYEWSFLYLDPMTNTYVDISSDISGATDSTGFRVTGASLDARFDTYAGTGTMITARVKVVMRHQGFADTTLDRFCYLNLKPYNGQVTLQPVVNTPPVIAAQTDIVMYWSGWVHNGRNRERDITVDGGGNLDYEILQIFLTDALQENTAILPRKIYNGPNLSKTFQLTSSKNSGTATKVRFIARDKEYPSAFAVVDQEVQVEPLFSSAEDASTDAVATLSSSILGSINETAGQNNINTVTDALVGLDALTSIDIQSENPLETFYAENDPSSNTPTLDDSVQVIDVDALVTSVKSEAVIDPILQEVQQTKEAAANAFFNSLANVNKSNPESLQDASTNQNVMSTLGIMMEGPVSQVTPKTLTIAVEIMETQIENTVNISRNPDVSDEVKQQVQEQALDTTNKAGKNAAIATNIGLISMPDMAAARELTEAENEFKTAEELEAEDNTNMPQDVRTYLQMTEAAKNSYEKEQRKQAARGLYNNMRIMTDAIVENIPLADGASAEFGKPGLQVGVKKDTGKNLATTPVQTESTKVTLPCLKDLDNINVKVAVSESQNMLLFDERSGHITSPMKTLRIELIQDLPAIGEATFVHQLSPAKIETRTPVIYSEDASKFDYHKVLLKDTTENVFVTFQGLSDRVMCYKIWAAPPKTGTVSKINYYRYSEACEYNNFTTSIPTNNRGVWSVGLETIFKDGHSPSRKRRSTSNATEPEYPPFGLGIATMSCVTWQNESWSNYGCLGTWHPQKNELECTCQAQKVMTFANTFTVPVNKIDFNNVFLKFSPLNQAAVMSVLALIFIIYALVVLWARRQDRQDLLKWGITPLSDNFTEDNYFYVIKVSTGLRPGAGTRSRVGLVIVGDEMDTGVRELYDGVRKEYTTGSVMNFLMSTNVYLGELEYIRIWHDNSGGGSNSSWYLSKIEVQDVQRNETFVFLGERWLAIDKEDGQLECVLPVCKTENLNIFKNRFYSNAKGNLAESHMWISVVYRPMSSHFTRVQRASCALAFIMLTMIANAMFFRSSDTENYETPADVQVGPFRFSLKQIYVSVICALITTPPIIILIYLFKLSRPHPNAQNQPSEQESSEKASRYKVPIVSSWLDKKRQKSVELEKHLVEKGYPKLEGCSLPYRCRWIAWILVFVICIVCSFFIMLYSMEWGKQKSEEWLTTFLLSFVESVLCLDPIKVAFMALILAILFRSTQESDNIIDRSTVMKKYTAHLRGASGGMRLPAPPLDNELLEEARNIRQRELKMRTAFRDVVINVFLIWIIFSISYSQRDSMSFQMHQEIVSHILDPTDGRPQFSKIIQEQDFYDWMMQTAIPSMFPERDINGEQLKWRLKQFTGDFAKFRVGPPRLRQVRAKKDSCTIPYMGTQPCYDKYLQPAEDTSSHCIGWRPGPCDPKDVVYKYTSDAWQFTSALDIWGFPISGTYTTYGGGGYISKLSVNKDVSLSILEELHANSWLDRQTRAVLFESTLYCINKNLFSYSIMMVEFPETGGAFPYYLILPLRVYTHIGPMGTYTLGCEIIFLIYLVVYTIIIVMGIVKQKREFFRKPWQFLDFLFVVISYIAIIMYGVREVMTKEALSVFTEDKKEFVNFFHIALWDQTFVMLIGFLVFLVTVRTLNILGYNKRISSVARVFSGAASQLIWFGVFFFVVFTIYAVFGFLLFGSKLKSYKNVYRTMGTLFISMIGKSKFTEIEETDPVISKIYFIIFIISIVYMILTMFLAILCKSIDQVHADTKTDKGDEMVDYVINKCKGMLAYGSPDVKPAPKQQARAAPPAPWTLHNQKELAELDNRAILQDLRMSLAGIGVDPRELKTPVDQKPVVKFRK